MMNDLELQFDGLVAAVFFGILQSILILIFLYRRKINKNHSFFIFFIIVLLISLIESFLVRSRLIFNAYWMFNASTPLVFLIGPSLLFYLNQQLKISFDWRKAILHYLPFLFYFVYSFNSYLLSNKVKYNLLVSSYYPDLDQILLNESFNVDPWNIQGLVVVEIFTLHIFAYCLYVYYSLYKRRKQLNNEQYRWIIYLNSIVAAGALILFFSEGGIINGSIFLDSPLPRYSGDLSISFAMYMITAYLLININTLKDDRPKYSKSSISENFKKSRQKVIINLMEAEKPFLNPDFSLDVLAKKCNLSKHHVSQILNEDLNVSFFEITNKYRIDEAKKILQSKKFIKMDQLALEIGYKSKATFFRVFKEITELTPTAYRTLNK